MNNKVLISIIVIILLTLAWSPWMTRKFALKNVAKETIGCEYSIYWIPFGRWIVNCETGHVMIFTGNIIL